MDGGEGTHANNRDTEMIAAWLLVLGLMCIAVGFLLISRRGW